MDGGKFVFQLLKIVCGFLAALISCGLFLSWGFFRATDPGSDPIAFATMVGSGLIGASVVGAAVLVPAGVLITIAELARLRSIIFHLAASGAIAFLIWTFGSAAGIGGLRPGSVVALAAGFCAGLVYWIIAGRTAGCWMANRPADNAPGKIDTSDA